MVEHNRDERAAQVREGQRMSRMEGARRPKKRPEPKGHEAFLKALEESGREQGTQIEVEKKSTGEKIVGVVRCSDHFTITVRVYAAGRADESSFVDRVLFKHDISEFHALGGKNRGSVND